MSQPRKKPKAAAQVKPAQKAMKLKSKADAPPHPADDPPSSEGLRSVPNPKAPAYGALDAEGQRPVLERSRKVR